MASIFRTVFVMLMYVAALLLLVACDASPDRVETIQASPLSRAELVRSRSNAGGGFSVSHQLLSDPVINETVTIELTLRLQSSQDIRLDFSANDSVELMGGPTQLFKGTQGGVIRATVDLIPRRAGKTYLKFIASSADGQAVRSYAVVLKVRNQDGSLPVSSKTQRNRINLPSQAE